MKRIVQIIITIVTFLGVTIALDLILGGLWGSLYPGNTYFVEYFGNFPQNQASTDYIEKYISFLSEDTLGWLAYTCLGVTKTMESLGTFVTINPLTGASTPAMGYIPQLLEYNAVDYPEANMLLIFGILKLILPLFVTSLMAGAVAKYKKQALLNAFLSILVIGVAGIILNLVHISYNAVSFDYKFNAILGLNYNYEISYNLIKASIWDLNIGLGPEAAGLLIQTPFMMSTSIIAIVYTLMNACIFSLPSIISAAKK